MMLFTSILDELPLNHALVLSAGAEDILVVETPLHISHVARVPVANGTRGAFLQTGIPKNLDLAIVIAQGQQLIALQLID